MTATQADSERTISRRGVMRATAVGIGAAAGVGAIGSTAAPAAAVDWGDVGTIAASTVVGGPIGLGWALRETEVLGSNPPAEGLTPGALKQQIYQTARTRKSTNASTIVDSGIILDGLENNAYTDAKIEAIEKLNAGLSESEVLESAEDSANTYFSTVQANLLKSWNESVSEFESFRSAISAHSDVSEDDVLGAISTEDGNQEWWEYQDATTEQMTLFNGDQFTIKQINSLFQEGVGGANTNAYQDPRSTTLTNSGGGSMGKLTVTVSNPDGDAVEYLSSESWASVYGDIETAQTNVIDGLSTWVTNVYSDVQSGEIEISELLTPRERAAMLSDDETEAQAIADLAALNIPIDSEREATISIAETGATLSGTIGLSDESDGPIEVGTTYDPSTLAGDVYLTADVSQISGDWTEYQSGVDGGTITLTAEPYDGVTYDVTTTAGETISVPADSWSATGSGTWTYDASSELENGITEVDSIAYSSSASEPQIETLRLTQQFTVDSITNRDTGEEVTAASFESSEPQNDSNYISQEEWDQLEQQNQELIDKYEESQNDGGGAGAGFFGDGGPSTGVIAAVVGGIGVVYALFGQEGT